MEKFPGAEYSVTPNRTVKLATGAVIAIFFVCATIIPLLTFTTEREKGGAGSGLFVLIIMVAIYAPVLYFTWGYAPQKYVLGKEGLHILRPIKSLTIPLDSIEKVEDKEGKKLGLMKKLGNQGVFAFTGSFYNKDEGTFYMYTKNAKYVMIFADKKYVVSPDEKDAFLEQIRGYL